jgi:hypothetical protein
MPKQTNAITPRWLTYQAAPEYCGLNSRTLRNYEKAGLLRVANVIIPGSTRGRRLIDRESLDLLIDGNVGTVTTAPICPQKGGAR